MQHLPYIISMAIGALSTYYVIIFNIYYIMKILRRRWKFKDTEKKVIRHHPFGISIGTDIVFGILVPEG